MGKEAEGIHVIERISRAERASQEQINGYRTMRRGKTERDKRTGATDQRLQNREERRMNNRKLAGIKV